jgi:hypothetical protein
MGGSAGAAEVLICALFSTGPISTLSVATFGPAQIHDFFFPKIRGVLAAIDRSVDLMRRG